MDKIPYTKSSLTPKEQVELLVSRGIAISDRSAAESYLKYHNYYQISGYVFYFEVKGTARTHQLARPVSFDQQLRELVFSAVSTVEMAVRCSVALKLSQAFGPFCFEQPEIFRKPSNLPIFTEKLEKAMAEHRNEPFIAHHTATYQERIPPAWVMVEVLTFGNISWLKALTELRNSCAHHMRLWNKVFVNYPKLRNADKSFPIIPGYESRLGSFVPMLCHILTVIQEKPEWEDKLHHLLVEMPLIRPSDIGLRTW